MIVVDIAVPLTSMAIGSAITYLLNVRTRRRSKVEEVLHEAISAVAVARASHDFIAELGPWRGATPEDHRAFNVELGRDGNRNYVRAVAEARAALARASAYEPALWTYCEAESDVIYARAAEIMALLQSCISSSRRQSRHGQRPR